MIHWKRWYKFCVVLHGARLSSVSWWVLAPGEGAPPRCLSHPEPSAGHGVAVETGGCGVLEPTASLWGSQGSPEGAAGRWCWWPREGLEVPCGESSQLMKMAGTMYVGEDTGVDV